LAKNNYMQQVAQVKNKAEWTGYVIGNEKNHERCERRIRNTDVLIKLPIPTEQLPEWVKQRRDFIENIDKIDEVFKKMTN